MMRTPHLAGAPVFSRPKQASTDALIPVPAAHGDLGNMAIDHFPVHWIRRLFEAGVYESNDLAAEFCDKGYNLAFRTRRVLLSLSIARRYCLKCRRRISFQIELGMIFSTFEERSGNAIVFWIGGADLNCRWVRVSPIRPAMMHCMNKCLQADQVGTPPNREQTLVVTLRSRPVAPTDLVTESL